MLYQCSGLAKIPTLIDDSALDLLPFNRVPRQYGNAIPKAAVTIKNNAGAVCRTEIGAIRLSQPTRKRHFLR